VDIRKEPVPVASYHPDPRRLHSSLGNDPQGPGAIRHQRRTGFGRHGQCQIAERESSTLVGYLKCEQFRLLEFEFQLNSTIG